MALFGIFIFIAILSFAGFIPSPMDKTGKELSGKLVLWGTEDKDVMSEFLSKVSIGLGNKISIAYKQKAKDTFAIDIIEALASGEGPDMIIMPQDLIVRLESKLAPFAPEDYSERDFKNA